MAEPEENSEQQAPAIDGGSTAAEEFQPTEVEGPHDPERHRQIVTLVLIGVLALVIFGHYTCVMILDWNSKQVDSVNSAYNAALPVVAGLAGSAVTYYFTRGHK